MDDELHDLVALLEQHRAEGRDVTPVLAVVAVRQLLLPLGHESCAELRAMAEVFQCDEALLGSAILLSGLRQMQQHLNADLDELAVLARKKLDGLCAGASEAL